MSGDPASQPSVLDELHTALGLITLALGKLAETDKVLGRARDAAAATGKPTDGLDLLRSEIATLIVLGLEHAVEYIGKMAEDEAGSRG